MDEWGLNNIHNHDELGLNNIVSYRVKLNRAAWILLANRHMGSALHDIHDWGLNNTPKHGWVRIKTYHRGAEVNLLLLKGVFRCSRSLQHYALVVIITDTRKIYCCGWHGDYRPPLPSFFYNTFGGLWNGLVFVYTFLLFHKSGKKRSLTCRASGDLNFLLGW